MPSELNANKIVGSSSKVIVAKAFPLLSKLFNDPTETANRPPVILLLCRLTDACHDVTILLPFKDELMGVLSAGFELSTCRQQTLALLQVMLAIRGLLTTEEIGYFIRTLTETFLQPSETNDEFKCVVPVTVHAAYSSPALLVIE